MSFCNSDTLAIINMNNSPTINAHPIVNSAECSYIHSLGLFTTITRSTESFSSSEIPYSAFIGSGLALTSPLLVQYAHEVGECLNGGWRQLRTVPSCVGSSFRLPLALGRCHRASYDTLASDELT